ncbi:uncharacterized protein LOC144018999 [Festucalex cinctus]
MLKELVRERLIAAADEIFGLFEKTIASYEEQLCRQRRQLEAVGNNQIVLQVQDAQKLIEHHEELPPQLQWGSSSLEQEHPQANNIKEEDPEPPHCERDKTPESPHVKDEEDPYHPQMKGEDGYLQSHHTEEKEEPDIRMLSMPGMTDDDPPEWSQLHRHSPSGDHYEGSPPDDLLAPLLHSDDVEQPLRSNADRRVDDKEWECSEKETTLGSKGASQMRTKKVTCAVCRKSFAGKAVLNIHMRTHTGESLFECSVCRKRFNVKANMVRHMITHTGEKPFSCSSCGKTFSLKHNLDTHMRIHTGEKPFSCSLCAKTFCLKKYLLSHMRIHVAEKPFSCSLCGKTFSRKQQQELHMATHTNNKPFSCSLCDKTFATKLRVVSHMRIHTGEKNNNSICDGSFAQNETWTAHMQAHDKGRVDVFSFGSRPHMPYGFQ